MFFGIYLGKGKVLYRFRRHDDAITSLSWCPAAYDVLQKRADALKAAKYAILTEEKAAKEKGNDETTVTPITELDLEKDKKENDSKSPSKLLNLWVNLKHADDEGVEEPTTSRPIPSHFDVVDDYFTETDFVAVEYKKEVEVSDSEISSDLCRPDVNVNSGANDSAAEVKDVSLPKEAKLVAEPKLDELYCTPPESPKKAVAVSAQNSSPKRQLDDDFLKDCAALKERILHNRAEHETVNIQPLVAQISAINIGQPENSNVPHELSGNEETTEEEIDIKNKMKRGEEKLASELDTKVVIDVEAPTNFEMQQFLLATASKAE